MSRLAKVGPWVFPLSAAVAGVALYRRFRDQPRQGEPPLVPGSLPIAGCAIEYGRDAGAFLQSCRARYGDVFTVPLFGRRMTFALNPHDVPTVLKQSEALSFMPIAIDMTHRIFGASPEGARQSSDPRLHELYRHIKPPEAFDINKTLQRKLDAVISAAVSDQFREEGLQEFIYRLLFPVTCDTIFGGGFYSELVQKTFQSFDDRFLLLAAGVPASLLPGCERDRAFLASRLSFLRRDASPLHRGRDEIFREIMSTHDGHRNHIGLLWAAQANTIPAAFWSLAFLLSHGPALTAIGEELRAVTATCGAPGAHNDAFVDVGLKQLVLLESAIQEALRLRTGSMTLRQVAQPFTFETDAGPRYALRQGDYLCLYPYLTHRDGEMFAQPDSYRFDRFFNQGRPPAFFKNGKRVKLPLLLFGGGVSMCPGRFMAMAEIKLLIALLLSRCEIEPQSSVVPLPNLRRAGLGVLTPLGDLRIRHRLHQRFVS